MVNNILSIDVEEIFHIEYARNSKNHDFTYRMPHNIPPILDFLKEQNVTATFFIVGELAEKFADIVRMIEKERHEIAFHGWSHLPLWKLNSESFRNEIVKFKKVYPSCMGYRAPSFSLSNDTKWALKILNENGFRYDSSVFPAWASLYGVSGAPMEPYKPSLEDISKEDGDNHELLEFPLMVYRLLGLKIPIAGGFWLRFWNVGLIKRGIKKMNKKGLPAVIYVHNWELDPKTPKLELTIQKNFITYHNLAKTKEKLLSLLKEFTFTSFTNYLHEKNCLECFGSQT